MKPRLIKKANIATTELQPKPELAVDREVKAFFNGELGWTGLSAIARGVILERAKLSIVTSVGKPTVKSLFKAE